MYVCTYVYEIENCGCIDSVLAMCSTTLSQTGVYSSSGAVVLVRLSLQLFLIALLFPVSDGTADGTEEDTVDVSHQGCFPFQLWMLGMGISMYILCVCLSYHLPNVALFAPCRASC